MDTMTLAVAGVAALAIVLIAIGVATSGGGGISDRLERYAAKPTEVQKTSSSGQGGVAELIAQSATLNNLNRVVEQRDFGANLARDIARADLKLKPSEFLAHLGRVGRSASRWRCCSSRRSCRRSATRCSS